MDDYTNNGRLGGNREHDNERIEQLRRLGLPDDARQCNPHRNFTLRKKVLEHPEFTAAVRKLADAHGRFLQTKAAQGLAFVGQSGSGKSTVIDYYGRKFPFQHGPTGRRMPVVRVITPESPTVKTLAQAFLDAMDAPSAKGTTQEKTKRFIKYVHDCGVQMLIIDEFQHFLEGGGRATQRVRSITDWLKNLLTECEAVVVLVGLPKSIRALNVNEQLRRRFASPHEMKPFAYVTAEQQRDFQDLLASLQQLLPCPSVALDTPEMARLFYFATMGLIDYVVKILDGAVSAGGTGPNGELQQRDLAEAFREHVWASCPEALNPFAPGALLRELTERNEPFEGWDDIHQYTMSKAGAALKQLPQRRGGSHE